MTKLRKCQFVRKLCAKCQIYVNSIIGNFKRKKDNFRHQQEKEENNNSKAVKEELISIRNALLRYMEEERPYLNSKLKLADISTAIGYHQAKVSLVLNQHLRVSCTDFINRYRVEEFKIRTQNNELNHYTITALSEKCGFPSRSSFFTVFKKMTGQTPLEYLRESGINQF